MLTHLNKHRRCYTSNSSFHPSEKHFIELTASKHNLAASEIMSNPAPCLRNLSARERYVGMGRGIQHTAAGAMGGEKNKRPKPEGFVEWEHSRLQVLLARAAAVSRPKVHG